LSYLLFFAWLIFLSWSLTKIGFVKNAGLGSKIIIGLFLCKVIAGLLAGWITANAASADTWGYHVEALKEYHLLFSNPKEYFTNLFQSGYSYGYNGVFVTYHSFWNDLKTNLVIKLVSVLDIFSGGSYYTNVILYNFLSFFGSIGLFRVLKHVYRSNPKLLAACTFLLPSLLYFGSTIHKDGIIFAATGVILFNVYYALHYTGFTFKRLFFIMLALLPVFLIRNYVFIALLPALAAMIISSKANINAALTFSAIYLISTFLFFNLHYLTPSINLPGYIVQKQADFLTLEQANTTIAVHQLQPGPGSFIANAPQALLHSLCRPFITDASLSILLLPLSIELLCYQLLLLLFIFFRRENPVLNNPVILFGVFFGLSVCLMIGYTVPVMGAIVRYRSTYLPFLLTPVIYNINWLRLYRFLQFKK